MTLGRGVDDGILRAGYATCRMHDQLGIFYLYIALLPVSIVVYALMRWRERRTAAALRSPRAQLATAEGGSSLPLFAPSGPDGDKRAQARANAAEIRRRGGMADAAASPILMDGTGAAGAVTSPWSSVRATAGAPLPTLAQELAAFAATAGALALAYVCVHAWDHFDP